MRSKKLTNRLKKLLRKSLKGFGEVNQAIFIFGKKKHKKKGKKTEKCLPSSKIQCCSCNHQPATKGDMRFSTFLAILLFILSCLLSLFLSGALAKKDIPFNEVTPVIPYEENHINPFYNSTNV